MLTIYFVFSVNLETNDRVTVKDFELLKVLGTGGKYSVNQLIIGRCINHYCILLHVHALLLFEKIQETHCDMKHRTLVNNYL